MALGVESKPAQCQSSLSPPLWGHEEPPLVQLLLPYADPFVQTAKENTPAMVARSKGKMEALKLLLPAHEMLSFADLPTFEDSSQAYKGHFTPNTADDEKLPVDLELALQLGDAALLQAIGTSKSGRLAISTNPEVLTR